MGSCARTLLFITFLAPVHVFCIASVHRFALCTFAPIVRIIPPPPHSSSAAYHPCTRTNTPGSAPSWRALRIHRTRFKHPHAATVKYFTTTYRFCQPRSGARACACRPRRRGSLEGDIRGTPPIRASSPFSLGQYSSAGHTQSCSCDTRSSSSTCLCCCYRNSNGQELFCAECLPLGRRKISSSSIHTAGRACMQGACL